MQYVISSSCQVCTLLTLILLQCDTKSNDDHHSCQWLQSNRRMIFHDYLCYGFLIQNTTSNFHLLCRSKRIRYASPSHSSDKNWTVDPLWTIWCERRNLHLHVKMLEQMPDIRTFFHGFPSTLPPYVEVAIIRVAHIEPVVWSFLNSYLVKIIFRHGYVSCMRNWLLK